MKRNGVRIITHTGCDLSLKEAEELGVKMVSDYVVFGDTSFRNRFELSPEQFFEKIEQEREFPTSSHPSVGDFEDAMEEEAKRGEEVLCLTITSRMSGTYMAAKIAAEHLREKGVAVPIFVYDTGQCSHGMAELVRRGAKLAEEGHDAAGIIKDLELWKKKVGVYVILESLKCAKRGGRVGAIKALAADSLGIKPLLVFEEGLVKDIGLCRSFADAEERLIRLFEKEGDVRFPITVFHSDAGEKAELFLEMIHKTAPGISAEIQMVGPVIGIYTGRGCVGMTYTKKE